MLEVYIKMQFKIVCLQICQKGQVAGRYLLQRQRRLIKKLFPFHCRKKVLEHKSYTLHYKNGIFLFCNICPVGDSTQKLFAIR